jgi:hypothetical protein
MSDSSNDVLVVTEAVENKECVRLTDNLSNTADVLSWVQLNVLRCRCVPDSQALPPLLHQYLPEHVIERVCAAFDTCQAQPNDLVVNSGEMDIDGKAFLTLQGSSWLQVIFSWRVEV